MARTLWRLTLALCGVLIAALCVPAMASTCGASYETYTDAMSACQAFNARNMAPPYNNPSGTCTNRPYSSGVGGYVHWSSSTGDGGGYGDYTYCSGGPSDQCKARAPLKQAFDGVNTTVVNGGCKYTLKADDDKAVKVCVVWNGKQFCTGSATWTPTGEFVGTPAINPDPAPAPPRVCGGGSCYDLTGNQYCASTGSGQVCVPASGAGSASGCSSSSGTTLCAGSPAPRPPNPPIADPASQIASSDNYTGQAGTGPVSNVTVNNFNATGSGAKNGAGTGDQGAPASGSSTGNPEGDGTSAGGGGDCNTPPMVEGSPALGMIARQTWLLRCSEAGQVTDDSNTTVPGLDDVGTTPGDGFSKEVTVLDKLDTSGFGGGTQCPKLPDLDLGALGHYSLNSDWWCDLLSKTGYMIMMLATWFALRILGEK